jgi:hypothetical protein
MNMIDTRVERFEVFLVEFFFFSKFQSGDPHLISLIHYTAISVALKPDLYIVRGLGDYKERMCGLCHGYS